MFLSCRRICFFLASSRIEQIYGELFSLVGSCGGRTLQNQILALANSYYFVLYQAPCLSSIAYKIFLNSGNFF